MSSPQSSRWKLPSIPLADLSDRARLFWSPSAHEHARDAASAGSTARQFDRSKQRARIYVSGISRLLMTLLLCAATATVLLVYSNRPRLSNTELRVFNALMIALPLAISANLMTSLSNYARLLRWRILASCYRPLDQFSLIFQSDQLSKAFELFARSGRSKRWVLPSRTQLLVSLWILVNLASVVAVSLLGLTFNATLSTTTFNFENGNLSVVDLSQLKDNYQSWGLQGAGSAVRPLVAGEPQTALQTIYQDLDAPESSARYQYRFSDRNPSGDPNVEALSQFSLSSSRHISANATCNAYPVLDVGNNTPDNGSFVFYMKNNNISLQYMAGQTVSYGTTYVLNLTDWGNCGPRCSFVYIYQGSVVSKIPSKPLNIPEMFYECNVSVSNIIYDGTSTYDESLAASAQAPDLSSPQALSVAGGIALSGINTGTDWSSGFAVYQAEAQFSLIADATAAAQNVASFAVFEVAAFDARGTRLDMASRTVPVRAPVVAVDWPYAGAILGLIPWLQLLTFIAVVAWANKAAILDDGPLGTAKLFAPLLKGLAARGSLLDDQELVRALGNESVAYASGPAEMPACLKVGIVEQRRGVGIENCFEEGEYD